MLSLHPVAAQHLKDYKLAVAANVKVGNVKIQGTLHSPDKPLVFGFVVGFPAQEMPFTQDGNLPLDDDPKLAWAQVNLAEDPVELNRAEPDTLLRVPGIGPKGARSIIAARRHNRLRELQDLKAIGVSPKRTAPYVLLDGKRPRHQPRLL